MTPKSMSTAATSRSMSRAKLRMKGEKGKLSIIIYSKTAYADVSAVEEAMKKLGLETVEKSEAANKEGREGR